MIYPTCFLQRHDDPLVFCLKHPGMGKEYFKAETEEQLDRQVLGWREREKGGGVERY